MPTNSQIQFIQLNINLIKSPILIVGSKNYSYDQISFKSFLKNYFEDEEIVGIDLLEGEDVDFIIDISNIESLKSLNRLFNTVIIMEVLRYVINPFIVTDNIYQILNSSGIVIISECLVIRESQMPTDNFRFTQKGIFNVFSKFKFDKNKINHSLARYTDISNKEISYNLEIYKKSQFENIFMYFLKRLFFKIYINGKYNKQDRLIAENRTYYIGEKL